MRLGNDVKKCVAFIGVGDGDGFEAFGTGFFINYKRLIYLVSAQHVIAPLGDDPFTVRINEKDGGPHDVQYDPMKDKVGAPWHVHDDPTVDVAVVRAGDWRKRGGDMLALPQDMFLTDKLMSELDVGVGDICYAVGLFRLLRGKKRNLPIVHMGNIAMIPDGDERIPVGNWRAESGRPKAKDQPKTTEFEGYLVEMTSLEGFSGSPVLVRPTINFRDLKTDNGIQTTGMFPFASVYLLGMWRSAWGADPDEALKADIGDHKVPVGIGCVEPVSKLIEVLESPAVVAERESALAAAVASQSD